jgi:hypothetical protein
MELFVNNYLNINSLIPYILASLKEEIRQSIVGIWETSSHQHHIE